MVFMKHAGLRDWWLQRISAPILSIYFVPLLLAWMLGYIEDGYAWYGLLSMPWMKVATVAMLLAYTVHARIGLWFVITDYAPRAVQSYLCAMWDLLIAAQLLVGLYVIWGF